MRRGAGCSCGEAWDRSNAHERLTDRVSREIVDKLRAAEAHFDFRRMHVDVDFVVGHFEEQQRGGKNCRRQNVAIGFVNGVKNQAISYEAAIHKNVDAVAVGALYLGTRSETRNTQRCRLFVRFDLGLGDC